MICCATLILSVKLAYAALRSRRPVPARSASACHAVAPTGPDPVLLEIGAAAGLLALLCVAIGSLAFGQAPSAFIDSLHQIGCLALGRAGTGQS